MRFSHFLLQAGAISTAPRLAVVMLAAAATFALAGCGRGGSSNITAPPPPESTESLDESENGAGGQTLAQQQSQTALNIPVRSSNTRHNGKFQFTWLHGLQTIGIIDTEGMVFGIQDTESKVVGNVSFSCTGQPFCEVQILRIGDRYDVTYEGNVTARLIYDAEKIFPSIEKGWRQGSQKFCSFNFGCLFSLNDPSGNRLIGGPQRSDELRFNDNNSHYFLVEDKTTRIPANHGWKGKRYALDLSRFRDERRSSKDDDQRMEAIFYTHSSGNIKYGRWLRIDGPNNDTPFLMTASGDFDFSNTAAKIGLGTLKGKVTYRGGATGYYSLRERMTGDLVTRPADAGHFTARATFQADFNNDDDLWIEGTINGFVDQNGQSKNWSIEFQRDRLSNILTGGDPRETDIGAHIQGNKPTIWTIDGTPAEPARKWGGTVNGNGRFVTGTFEAVHGTDGRMDGSFGAERH